MKQKRKYNIYNDFEKKAIFNSLREFDIIDTILYAEPNDSCFYCFFIKHKDFILCDMVFLSNDCSKESLPANSAFVSYARDRLNKLQEGLETIFLLTEPVCEKNINSISNCIADILLGLLFNFSKCSVGSDFITEFDYRQCVENLKTALHNNTSPSSLLHEELNKICLFSNDKADLIRNTTHFYER